MSDKKISDLVELTSLAADDVLPVVDASANATKRITGANLSKFPSGVTVPDGGTIGSASDADAITIDATGNVALSQALQLGDGTAISSLGADSFRLTADATSTGKLTAWERVDEARSAGLGSNVSVSSGDFNVPNDGIWMVALVAFCAANPSTDPFVGVEMQIAGNRVLLIGTTDNGSGSVVANVSTSFFVGFLRTTDTLTFETASLSDGAVNGNTNETETAVTFVRLGDA